jgi:hypothetical protein
MEQLMTDRSLLKLLHLPALLLYVFSFAISPEVAAKSKLDGGPGNGKGQGRLKKAPENSPPTISGTPDETVLEKFFYEFAPDASDSDGDPLSFTITNKPGWADFDDATAALFGSPTAADVGRYSSIQIAVSDGLVTTALDPFTIDVTSTALATVTLQWQPPTENTDGTSLSDLAGYRIYYGPDPDNLNHVIEFQNPGLTTYVVEELTPSIWYFAMTAFNSQGLESNFSNQQTRDTH